MQALLAKLALTLALDKRTWKVVAVIITAILLPIILLILALGSLFGSLDSATKRSTESSEIVIDENDVYANFVRDTLAEIEIKHSENYPPNEEKTTETEETDTKIEEKTAPDLNYIKAVFIYISANLSESECNNFNIDSFINCFKSENPFTEINKLYSEINLTESDKTDIDELQKMFEKEVEIVENTNV